MAEMEFGFDTSKLKAYSGYYYDSTLLLESASGGAANELAEVVLQNGGVVFGVSYTSDYRGAEYCYIESKEDLIKIKGSKYIESSKDVFYDGKYQSVYSVVEQKLQEGKEVLFIGLGCVVAALYSVLSAKKVDSSNLFTVELICMGPTSSKVAKCFVDDLEQRYKSKLCSFSVRYKKDGWTPPYIRAVFENGKKYTEPFYQTEYGYAFGIYSRPSCYQCNFKGENHKGDITVGDYWGITKADPNYNKNGVSIIIIQSPRGEQLLSRIDTNRFLIAPADLSFALRNNPRYYSSNKKNHNWEIFGKYLNDKGLHYAVIHSQGRLKYFLRKTHITSFASRVLPRPAKEVIKRILNR